MDQDEEQIHPLTGEPFDEASERAKLISLGPKEKPVTPEMQRAFVEEHIPKFTRNLDPLIVVKERLFFAGEFQYRYERYYFIPQQAGFSHLATFEMLKSQKLNRLSILLLGEQVDIGYFEKDRLRIEYEPEAATEILSITGAIDKERLFIVYDEEGNLVKVNINSASHLYEDPDFTLYGDEILETLDNIKKAGTTRVNAAESVYELGFDEENDTLTIIRREGEKLKDDISIPIKLNIKSTIKTLVPREILEDPVRANLKYDESWKNANLETFGIKWQRE